MHVYKRPINSPRTRTGTGVTLKEDGSVGVPEMMVRNMAVKDLPELAVLPFSNEIVLGSTR